MGPAAQSYEVHDALTVVHSLHPRCQKHFTALIITLIIIVIIIMIIFTAVKCIHHCHSHHLRRCQASYCLHDHHRPCPTPRLINHHVYSECQPHLTRCYCPHSRSYDIIFQLASTTNPTLAPSNDGADTNNQNSNLFLQGIRLTGRVITELSWPTNQHLDLGSGNWAEWTRRVTLLAMRQGFSPGSKACFHVPSYTPNSSEVLKDRYSTPYLLL